MEDENDSELILRHLQRQSAVNKLGNLTLLTQSLNTAVSHGPFSVKMPVVRSHSSLALNRDLNNYDVWDEVTIAARGLALFNVARQIWISPIS